ncbi:MAG: SHOCT domain-containing protein [Pandoraea sp.]|nr:MAG: SHOCT domain-containing protein [Pandoraea sp.]TAM19313.1 MAG: SHOCT domain-containing protein [Pandoraea sp.]
MMGGFGFLMMILLVVIVVAVVVMLTRRASGFGPERQERRRKALDILDERYARGEIDADEYQRRRADLER